MRSRVAIATAVSRALRVAAGVIAVLATDAVLGAPAANATVLADQAVRESIDLGVTGEVGVAAVLVGAVGMVFGLTRRRRRALARRAEERARAGSVTG
jgi:hypothetical protein